MRLPKLLRLAAMAIALTVASAAEMSAAHADPSGATVEPASKRDKTNHRKRPEASERKREKVRERIRAMRAWKLTEALDLDEAGAAKLFPVLGRYDERFEALVQENAAIHRQMRLSLEAGRTAELNALIDRAVAMRARLWKLEEERFAAVRKVLSPERAATLLVVLPEIDRRIHRQVVKAMRRAGAAPTRGPSRESTAELPADPF